MNEAWQLPTSSLYWEKNRTARSATPASTGSQAGMPPALNRLLPHHRSVAGRQSADVDRNLAIIEYVNLEIAPGSGRHERGTVKSAGVVGSRTKRIIEQFVTNDPVLVSGSADLELYCDDGSIFKFRAGILCCTASKLVFTARGRIVPHSSIGWTPKTQAAQWQIDRNGRYRLELLTWMSQMNNTGASLVLERSSHVFQYLLASGAATARTNRGMDA